MKVAVFSKIFPVMSETFVINQIIGLIDLGVEVDIFVNETTKEKIMHSSIEEYGLMGRVKSIGICSLQAKYKRFFLGVFNIFKLLSCFEIKKLASVLFDGKLFSGQKLNLLSAITSIEIVPRKYDNIICHFGDNAYYVHKMRSLGLFSGPISVVFHGYELSRYEVLEKYKYQYQQAFKHCEFFLPISDLWKKKLIELGCEQSKIKVHRMGIDIDSFNIINIRKKLSKPLKVIQVGRLTEKKAILNSIQAVVIAKDKVDLQFTIIGDGELFFEAKKLIVKNKAESYIKLLGSKPQVIVKEYLQDSDVFVLPSIRACDGDMEGIPVALMEAMATGLLVLSTYHSGIPELITNQESGFLVEEGNVKSLADSIIAINNLKDEQVYLIRKKAREVCSLRYNNKYLNKELAGIKF